MGKLSTQICRFWHFDAIKTKWSIGFIVRVPLKYAQAMLSILYWSLRLVHVCVFSFHISFILCTSVRIPDVTLLVLWNTMDCLDIRAAAAFFESRKQCCSVRNAFHFPMKCRLPFAARAAEAAISLAEVALIGVPHYRVVKFVCFHWSACSDKNFLNKQLFVNFEKCMHCVHIQHCFQHCITCCVNIWC